LKDILYFFKMEGMSCKSRVYSSPAQAQLIVNCAAYASVLPGILICVYCCSLFYRK